MSENNFSIKGVIYEIYKRNWVGKKDPSKSGTTYYYIIDVPTFRLVRFQDEDTKEWKEQPKTDTQIVKIELPYKMNPDVFLQGSEISVDFYIDGNEFFPTDGRDKMFFNENKLTSITLIKKPDTDRPQSNTYTPPTTIEEFPQAESDDDDNMSDLPF